MKLFWPPRCPRATHKRKPSSIISSYLGTKTSTCYNQALAWVLRLTIRTTSVPYFVNTQSAATIRCVVKRGHKGQLASGAS